jgi:tripartite-type tricarboxylate transporter receptor subunit TctC
MGMMRTAVTAMALLTSVTLPFTARADAVADFYRGKTVNMLIGIGAGGEYDMLARTIAKYIVRYIPGNPVSVSQNMTGAGGLKMTNFLFNQAQRDGTYMAVIQSGLPAAQVMGVPGISFDIAKFNWLGTIQPAIETLVMWHTTGVKTIADATKREYSLGASSRGSNTYAMPALMNAFFGTKFKIVTGYTGGNLINLAMERGEVDGRVNSWASWKTTKGAWLKEKKIVVIAQAGPKVADLDAPSLEQLAKSDDDRKIIELVLSGSHFGRPITTTPGVPPERLAALRTAFNAVMKDKDFLAEMAAKNYDVAPITGEQLQRTADKLVATPRALAERARKILGR